MKMRTEKDSLGEKHVPADAYYGIQTVRAVENYPISGFRAHPQLIRAMGMIKKAAAMANRELKLGRPSAPRLSSRPPKKSSTASSTSSLLSTSIKRARASRFT